MAAHSICRCQYDSPRHGQWKCKKRRRLFCNGTWLVWLCPTGHSNCWFASHDLEYKSDPQTDRRGIIKLIHPQRRSKTHLLSLLFSSFRDLLTPTSSSPTTYLTLITGRHKREMNNTYEHTTLAHNSRNGWERNTRHLGLGQLNFTNIFEDMDPRMLSILGI